MTLVADVKKILRQFIPHAVLEQRRQFVRRSFDRRYGAMPPRELFAAIYRGGLWGRGKDRFYSGEGSHHSRIVDDYVTAISRFIEGLAERPGAVDLGCGDFNIGRRVQGLCARYVACDVVPELIERNRAAFPEVDFRCLDIVTDPLPAGDVAFIRQVLQHLDNAQIAQVLPKLRQYRWLVVTEHLPDRSDFAASTASRRAASC